MPELTTVTVNGTWLRLDSTPALGAVRFTLSGRLVSITDDLLVIPGDLSVNLDASGSISVELAATDNPDYIPTGLYWLVTEYIDGRTRQYAIALPGDPPVQSLADIAPIDPLDPGPRYSLSPDVSDLLDRIVTAEGDIDDLEAADVVLDGRLDVLEPLVASHTSTLATHTSQIAALQAADVSLDGRLDVLEAEAKIYVQNADPGMTDPGLWIQTGLAPGGTGMTFWVETGV